MIASLKALREAWRERSVPVPVPPQCLTPSSSPGVPLVRRIAFNSQTGVEMGPYKLMENYGRWPLLEGSRSPVAFVWTRTTGPFGPG